MNLPLSVCLCVGVVTWVRTPVKSWWYLTNSMIISASWYCFYITLNNFNKCYLVIDFLSIIWCLTIFYFVQLSFLLLFASEGFRLCATNVQKFQKLMGISLTKFMIVEITYHVIPSYLFHQNEAIHHNGNLLATSILLRKYNICI